MSGNSGVIKINIAVESKKKIKQYLELHGEQRVRKLMKIITKPLDEEIEPGVYGMACCSEKMFYKYVSELERSGEVVSRVKGKNQVWVATATWIEQEERIVKEFEELQKSIIDNLVIAKLGKGRETNDEQANFLYHLFTNITDNMSHLMLLGLFENLKNSAKIKEIFEVKLPVMIKYFQDEIREISKSNGILVGMLLHLHVREENNHNLFLNNINQEMVERLFTEGEIGFEEYQDYKKDADDSRNRIFELLRIDNSEEKRD